MIGFIFRRCIEAACIMLVTSGLVFVGVFAIGNPVDILVNPQADQLEIAQATAALGLDKPLWQQYLLFLWNALHGDLGRSFVFNQPSLSLILSRMPATVELATAAIVIAIVLGVPLGLWAGVRPNGAAGKTIMAASVLGFSLPIFWVAIMLILIFAVWMGWLPSTGRGATVRVLGIETSLLTSDGLAHIVLPATSLALFRLALIIRLVRAGTREAISTDYMKFGRAKGLSPARLVFVHLLRNILIPVTTVIGLEFGATIAFAVVTETIFAWPGMGRLIIQSIAVLDRPVIVAYLMMTVLMFVIINLVVDILYVAIDPRVRLGDQRSAP